jgi:hypothetical protein
MVLVPRLKQWVGALSLCPAAGAVGYVIKNWFGNQNLPHSEMSWEGLGFLYWSFSLTKIGVWRRTLFCLTKKSWVEAIFPAVGEADFLVGLCFFLFGCRSFWGSIWWHRIQFPPELKIFCVRLVHWKRSTGMNWVVCLFFLVPAVWCPHLRTDYLQRTWFSLVVSKKRTTVMDGHGNETGEVTTGKHIRDLQQPCYHVKTCLKNV